MRMRARRRQPVTSRAPDYYSSSGTAMAASQQLKLTSYSSTVARCTTDPYNTRSTAGETLSDSDYYKSRHHTAGACYHDDAERKTHYVEHIYESPKFDKRQVAS